MRLSGKPAPSVSGLVSKKWYRIPLTNRNLLYNCNLLTAQFSPRTKWAHLLFVPFIELTRRFPKGSLRRNFSGSES